MIEIRPILTSDIPLYWTRVAPLIEKSLDHGNARHEWTIEGIYETLLNQEKSLWIVFKNGEIIAAVITSIIHHNFTGNKTACIDFAGGEDFKSWSMFTDYIEPIYKSLGCGMITIAGRLGWLRLHTDKGYKPIYHVIGKRLCQKAADKNPQEQPQ